MQFIVPFSVVLWNKLLFLKKIEFDEVALCAILVLCQLFFSFPLTPDIYNQYTEFQKPQAIVLNTLPTTYQLAIVWNNAMEKQQVFTVTKVIHL